MNNVFEVSSLLESINNIFKNNLFLKDLWIRGEITDLRQVASSGHKYFQIKDDKSLIRCVYFRFLQNSLDDFEDGDFVLINGEAEIYQPRGDLTIKVKSVKKEGLGDLSKEIQILRKRLESEGLFEESRKRSITKFPKSISVITSPNSSAWEDIKKTISDRYQLVSLNLLPTLMQGENCADDVVSAIKYSNKLGVDDIIIISRGGGSEQDLMPFNLEKISRAIFSSTIPVITGIGHEDDVTTADLVADIRGLTPTSAAQIAVPDMINIKDYISRLNINLIRILDLYINNKTPDLKNYQSEIINNYENKLTNLFQKIDIFETDLISKYNNNIASKISKLELIKNSIEIYNIKKMASKGFSLIENNDNKIIRSMSDVQIQEEIKILISDGIIHSTVHKKEKN